MNNSISKIVSLIFLMAGNYIHTSMVTPVFAKTYAACFGNQDASLYYQEMVRSALTHFGVPEVEQVMIKKMNRVASKMVGSQLYSFTLEGIWLNEELLEQLDENIRTFVLYHEAAHYAAGHHYILLKKLVPAVAAAGFGVLISWHTGNKYPLAPTWVAPSLAGIIGSYGVYTFVVQPYEHTMEMEADRLAAQKLCELNKYDLVHAYIHFLQNIVHYNDDTSPWWQQPITSQISNLQAIVMNSPLA